jgi:recombination associated protein RdgC
MFFKNLMIYRVLKPLDLNAMQDMAGQRRPARPCMHGETSTLGWWPPLGRRGSLYQHTVMGRTMLCARKYEKVIPSPAVNEKVDAKAYELEQSEERPVGRNERKQIKEAVIAEMLPNVPEKPRDTYLYYDALGQLLIIDTSSENQATEILGMLRDTLGELHVKPFTTAASPRTVMTRWLYDGIDQPFTLGDSAVLDDPHEEGSKATFAHHELSDETIRAHLDSGMQVAKLAIEYDERIECMVDDGLTVTRLVFKEIVKQELDDVETETEADRFDADFALMAGELARLVDALVEVFGGEQQDEMKEAA